MSTYRQVRASRGVIWAGVALGYLIALAVAVINLRNEHGTLLIALAFLAFLGIPSTLALWSLDRRPSLLPAAAMGALIQGFLLLFSIGLLEVVVAILWFIAIRQRPRPALTPGWAVWARPLIAATVVIPLLVMYLHLDPRCTVTDADGNVISTTVNENSPSGFGLQLGGWSQESNSSAGETTTCSSDIVQPWEAAGSLTASAMILGLARRWPDTVRLEHERNRS